VRSDGAAAPRVLVLPGLGGSGEAHWQTIWQARHGYARVEQSDWDRPARDAWVERLDEAIARQAGEVVLVAHSLACALVAHWAAAAGTDRVAAALLVAPADVDSAAHTPPETRSFAPMPLTALPFASLVVASATDPYVALERARHFAACWGARFVDLGDAGHINADAGLGAWDAGHALLMELLRTSMAQD